MLEIGYVLDGKYKILNVVGRGGMSVVYLAMNEKANKQWAIKEVRKDGVKDFEVVKQSLVAEIDMLKRLDHPNLPSIVDVIEEADRFLIVMDYVQGNSLGVALDEYGAQPQELVIEWAKQLCDVLGYLHTRQPAIIYRDMKPANVMLKPDGNVTLIDFGTAREFKERNIADTTCLGTIGYAAPEQFGGMGQTDGRTDIYCLGTTLYHLVTGMNPCEPPYEIRPIRQINPSLSSGLEKIILKCTRPNPSDRYQSAAELMYDLEHYEEIDELFIKKQKRKIRYFTAAAVASACCFITSGINYTLAENAKSDKYSLMIAEANTKEGDEAIAAYMDAMCLDPTREEAYKNIYDIITADPEITPEEKGIFDGWTTTQNVNDAMGRSTSIVPINELEKGNKPYYEELCLEVGKAILIRYDAKVESDKFRQAGKWFERIRDYNSNAERYSKIVDCLEKIEQLKKVRASNKDNYSLDDEKQAFEDLWNLILEIRADVKQNKDGSQDYSLDYEKNTYMELVSFIDDPKLFIDSGVCTKEEMKEFIDDIEKELQDKKTARYGEDVENYIKKISIIRGKLETVKEKGE